MLDFFRWFWRSRVLGTFITGVLVLLPVVLTIFIIVWIIQFLRGLLGPGSLLGDLLTIGGNQIIGAHDVFSFWLGLAIALVGIWFVGAIVRSEASRRIQSGIDQLFTRVPLIGAIYSPVSRVVRLATERGGGDLTGMKVVTLRLGGAQGTDILALLASSDVYLIDGERRLLVYLPTAPVPMTGGLVLVPESSVTVIPDMKVEDLLKIYVSLGALGPESMPPDMVIPRKQPSSLQSAHQAERADADDNEPPR